MSADLYCDHFGFAGRPFALPPDPDFLFWTRAHSRAYAILQYGIMTHAPLTVVTGEVGTGKTTLVQAMLQSAPDDIVVGLMSNCQGDRDDLLRWVLNAFDVPHAPDADYVTLFQALQDFVLETYASGRTVVIIIDEAQNLGRDSLEEVRMLTNINSGKDELLQLILVGQPELREMLERPELRQFAQRVSATYHIDPLSPEAGRSYIRHRLVTAGGTGDEISVEAADLICSEADGIPRNINKIADLALVYAASDGARLVEAAIVEDLLRDGIVLRSSLPQRFSTTSTDPGSRAAE